MSDNNFEQRLEAAVKEAVFAGHGAPDTVLGAIRRKLSVDDVRRLLAAGHESAVRQVEATLRTLARQGQFVLEQVGPGAAWRGSFADDGGGT